MLLLLPDRAGAQVETVLTHVGSDGQGGPLIADILLVNGGDKEEQVELPERLSARVDSGEDGSVWLARSADTPARLPVSPGGFVRVRYRSEAAFVAAPDAIVSIPFWRTARVAVAGNSGAPAAEPAPETPANPVISVRTARAEDGSVQSLNEERTNSFLGNFSAYEPSYIVFGTASESEWRVQASFKYRVLGSAGGKEGYSWSDGLYLGFTQKLFWDIASDASFRDVNYLPELFYRTRSIAIDSSLQLSVQAGVQHESNGRSGDVGRSANNVYMSPMARFNLGDGYSMSLAPRYTVLIGGRAGNPDLMKYRGHASLSWQIGQDEGWRLSSYGRLNFSTGKGAVQTELSYPLPSLLGGGGPGFYLFGQVFAGYGESLLDYNRRMTRFRLGFAITR